MTVTGKIISMYVCVACVCESRSDRKRFTVS